MSFHADLYMWISDVQRGLREVISTDIREIAETGVVVPSIAAVALFLGAVHALTPGHGKAVIATYFLGREARPIEGFSTAGKIAFSHTVTAILLVVAFGGAVSLFGRPHGAARILQTMSYGLIAGIGLFYLVRSFLPASPHGHQSYVLPFAVGVLPCPLTMLVVGQAMALGATVTGFVLAGLMGVGAALTIGIFGLLGMGLRRAVLGQIDPSNRWLTTTLMTLEIASSALIMFLGIVMFAGDLPLRF